MSFNFMFYCNMDMLFTNCLYCTVPWAPGGSKFTRNPIPPAGVIFYNDLQFRVYLVCLSFHFVCRGLEMKSFFYSQFLSIWFFKLFVDSPRARNLKASLLCFIWNSAFFATFFLGGVLQLIIYFPNFEGK